jgi:Flp pilus assembly protein TadD
MPYLQPSGELYLALAECSFDAGMFFDAMIALRVAMALDPQDVACQQLMARVMAQHGRQEEARQYEAAAKRLSAQASPQEPTSGTAAVTKTTIH